MSPTPSSLSALIEKLEELEKDATQGEWVIESGGIWLKEPNDHWFMADVANIEDEALILALRNNAKTLLALSRWAEGAKGTLEELKQHLDKKQYGHFLAKKALDSFPPIA